MADPLTAEQLLQKYPADEFGLALGKLLNVRQLLKDCLITSGYRVSNSLHQPLSLTKEGDKAVEFLTRRASPSVPYPEARLMCLLELWNIDLLIDPIATDMPALLSVIGQQVANREIRFPFIYGRLLYDKAAQLKTKSGRYMSETETQDFLSGTPQGVFQGGRYVTGPYGLLRSQESRVIEAVRSVPYHCSDVSCTAVHWYALTTGEAPINEMRPKMRKYLEKESSQPSDWDGYIKLTLKKFRRSIYDDFMADPLVYLVGDALTIDEQRKLLVWLLSKVDDDVWSELRRVGLNSSAEGIASDLGAAQMLQLILLATNKQIIQGIDTLTLTEKIHVPSDEIRAPVINQFSVGPYRLTAELGRYGLRIESAGIAIAPLRLRRLVAQMYPLDTESEREELDWQMRGEGGDSTEERVERFLQRRSPRDVVTSLLLVRHSNFIVASEKLGLQDDLLKDDQDRVNAVLWKLGFYVSDEFDPLARFWRYHENMKKACGAIGVNPRLIDIEDVKERSGPYFPALEGILKDTLVYVTWAMLYDHYSSGRPFIYHPETAPTFAIEQLKAASRESQISPRVNIREPLMMGGIVPGFRLLAELLNSVLSKKPEYARPEADWPVWASAQDLQLFPFKHRIPFLDLLPDSQVAIIDGLQRISDKLLNAEIVDLRNSLSHPRSTDLLKLQAGLEVVEEVLTFLRSSGFIRQAFRPVSTAIDEAGRTTIELADPYGQTTTSHQPSYFEWLDMPGPSDGVQMMVAAYFYEPSNCLRFRTEAPSEYSRMWQNYPLRQEGTDTPRVDEQSAITQVPGQRR